MDTRTMRERDIEAVLEIMVSLPLFSVEYPEQGIDYFRPATAIPHRSRTRPGAIAMGGRVF
jgi:hypothetical protein